MGSPQPGGAQAVKGGREAAIAEDDRAALYGALLGIADLLKGADGPEMLTLWRRRGRRMFEAEAVSRDPASEALPAGD